MLFYSDSVTLVDPSRSFNMSGALDVVTWSWFNTFLCPLTLDQHEEIVIKPRTAIEGVNVNLTCRASRYLYTDLRWLDSRNQTVTSGVSSLQFSNYSIFLTLYLHNVSKNSSTGYRCQAYKVNNRVELKTAALTVDGKKEDMRSLWLQNHLYSNDSCTWYCTLAHTGTQKTVLHHLISHCLNKIDWAIVPLIFFFFFGAARKHPWLSQNLTNQDVNSSSTLILTCLALGVPHPDITWYKNGVPVEEAPGNSDNSIACAMIMI